MSKPTHQLIAQLDSDLFRSILDAERNPAPEKISKPKSRARKDKRYVSSEQRTRIVAAAKAQRPHTTIAKLENLPPYLVRRIIEESAPTLIQKRRNKWDYSGGRAINGDR